MLHLLQTKLINKSGFDPDEFLDYFYKEAERLAKVYLIENRSEDFDPVKVSGSLALASSFIFEAIEEVEEEQTDHLDLQLMVMEMRSIRREG